MTLIPGGNTTPERFKGKQSLAPVYTFPSLLWYNSVRVEYPPLHQMGRQRQWNSCAAAAASKENALGIRNTAGDNVKVIPHRKIPYN